MTSEPNAPTVGDAPPESKPLRKRPRLNAAGEERPAFLLAFPEDPELEKLMTAFEQGNFAEVRALAPELASRTGNPEVRRAALELRRRIDPDPLLIVLLLFALSLFLFLVVWVYSR
jgi:hypothetical protein